MVYPPPSHEGQSQTYLKQGARSQGPKALDRPVLDLKQGARSKVRRLWTVLYCFNRSIAGSWMESEGAGTQTSSHLRSPVHVRKGFQSLSHWAGPETPFLFVCVLVRRIGLYFCIAKNAFYFSFFFVTGIWKIKESRNGHCSRNNYFRYVFIV